MRANLNNNQDKSSNSFLNFHRPKLGRFSSVLTAHVGGAPIIQGSQLGGANDSFFSCGKSVGTNGGGGLAKKISMAMSRVVWNRNNSTFNDEDEVADLIQIIEELNQHSDLTVKLNNQNKIFKLIEANDELFFP